MEETVRVAEKHLFQWDVCVMYLIGQGTTNGQNLTTFMETGKKDKSQLEGTPTSKM